MKDAELYSMWEAETAAFYKYQAEARGDNTRGRVLPSRVAKAQEEWYALFEALRAVATSEDVRAMLQRRAKERKVKR